MKHRTAWCATVALLLVATAGAAPPDTTGSKAGSITALLPLANIVRGPAKQEVTAVAKKGDDVVWNDLVRTDKGGRARITLLDQSILSVGSQAELRIVKHDAKSQQTSIEVGYGRVRAEVAPFTKQGSSFEVKTPTAVAGVIGTVFGIDSAIGVTTFLCFSGTVMVGSNDPNIPGRVPCTAGMAVVVSAGKAPVTRPATQQEIRQFVQDTEPALISAMNPNSLLPGATADATITGTQLGNINAVSSSSSSVTVTLNAGGTATSVSVHLAVAANATPGPVTLTLSAPAGVPSAAVFSVLAPQAATAGEAPSIKGLSTTAAPPTGGVPVTITGTNFDPTTKVMFGNVASSNVTFLSSTQLTVIVPPGNPGPVDITVVTGSGLTTTLSGGFSFGGPVAAISPPEINVNPGVQVTLDGSRSSDTLAGATLSYSWTFCGLGFKPPQASASLPAMNAPICTAAPGTVAGTDSLFSLTPPTTPGQYFARLQVTDNLGASAVIFISVTVSQPSYDDPATRMNSLAQAFSTLQSSSVLAFFDPSYTGLTTLQQSLQTVFPTYSSMQVNLLSVTPNITGNTAQVQANWQLRYTIKDDPACRNIPNCQPPTYSPLPETQTTVWTLNPSKGWFVTEFRVPNGFTQGTLPAVPVTTTSQPDLKMISVDSPNTPGLPIPVSTGAQSFRATVQNVGTADFTQTATVAFNLTDTGGGQLGSSSGPIGPIAVGKTAQVTVAINVPTTLSAVTSAQVSASVNTGCPIAESDCTNNGGTFPVVITPASVALPNLRTQITNVSSGATLGAGPQTIQATVTNAGSAAFSASVPVNFAVIVAGNTVVSAQGTITGPVAVNQAVNVQANLTIPATIPAGTPATLTVVASPSCPNPVEPDCTDNTASLSIVIGVPPPLPTIIISSSAGNTASASPLQLNGPLTAPLTLVATRSDGITTGSVTLTFTGAQVSSTPPQLTSVAYGSRQLVDFAATIDAGGNLTTGAANVTVTPSQAQPLAGSQPTTLFFNIGDIDLSGAPSCLLLTGGQTPAFTFTISALSGFNVPSVNWQWAGLAPGISVSQVSGTATLSGGAYTLPSFTLTSSITGTQTFLFAVTIIQGSSSATKVFTLNVDLSATCGVGAAGFALRRPATGSWSRGAFGGGMARLTRPAQTVARTLPDLQINASSVSFTPSIPKPGDTVAVRFRVTNAGNADAQRVPIALVVNGVAVASDTFDVRAGASTLAALEWTNARALSASRAVQAAVVVDPNHTVAQKSALAKSAPLARFAFLPTWGAQTGTQLPATAQRATLEVADGGCVGFRFASGAGSACGSADVEISVEQLASGRYTLAAQIGIADLGPAFGGGKLAAAQYQPEAPAVAGHSYAVQLRGGKTGILRLMAIRNPAQAGAKGRQVFRGGNVARNVGGATTGPVETGDVSGVRTPSQSKVYFDVSYQTQ